MSQTDTVVANEAREERLARSGSRRPADEAGPAPAGRAPPREARALVAEEWIQKNRLTGILTLYPVDIGVYEWAIERGMFTPSKPHEQESAFIGGLRPPANRITYEAGRLDS